MSARPKPQPRSCPACGASVDLLRAPRVVLLEDGFRYLCGQECRDRFVDGDRAFDETIAPATRRVAVEPEVRPSRISLVGPRPSASRPSIYRQTGSPTLPWPRLALSAAAVVLAATNASWFAPVLATSLVVTGAFLDARNRHERRALPWSTAAIAPLGVGIAAVAALFSVLSNPTEWGLLVGAALAGGLLALESWMDEQSALPIALIVNALADQLPTEATPAVVEPGSEKVPLGELRSGDEVIVFDGETIPVDGVVSTDGSVVLLHPTAVQPMERKTGDFVWAGGQVLQGPLTVRVRRSFGERALERVDRLSSGAALDDSLSGRFRLLVGTWGWVAASVLAIAALLLVPDGRLMAAAAVLIAMPLIAIRRGIDSPIVSAGSAGATRGILFGSRRALSLASRASVTAMLTRGTLTTGRVSVKGIYRVGDLDSSAVLGLAAAAESASEDHPFAIAIVAHASEVGARLPVVRRACHLPGRGVKAMTTKSEEVVVGSRQFLLQEGVSVAMADSEAVKIENQGQTPVFVGLGGRVQAVIAVDDPLRLGAPTAVQRITDLPSEVVLISGDHRVTVEHIAESLHIPRAKAGLLPEERVAEVRQLADSGETVAAVGRGGYDEQILSQADVAVVLGAAGSSLDDGHVAVMSHDIRDAGAALWIARASRQETRRTLGITLAASAILALGACLGLLHPLGAALSLLAIDAFALRAGARLLRRIDLRMPVHL